MFASGDSLVCFFALFPKAKCLSLCLANSPWHIPPIHLTTNTSQKELIPRTAVQREFAREETIGHFQYYNFLVSCLLCKVVLRSLYFVEATRLTPRRLKKRQDMSAELLMSSAEAWVEQASTLETDTGRKCDE